MTDRKVIFKFDHDCSYKGVLSAEMDKYAVEDFFQLPRQSLTLDKSWIVEILGFIWTDPQGEWHMKIRLKFPSGNKQVFGKSFGIDSTEEEVLEDIYKLPMVNKRWFQNKVGTVTSLFELLKEKDMIESITVTEIDENISDNGA